ncbi:hypothetical protein [Sphingobacterium bovistauri]|uniref:DUF5723 domain-containing protein n=1 Tax=Sphingobacterium bovistauri TaxID=2781959 RepID=A0ABS7Z5L7_9SPHI|nr:hypothetical protein [Sphingobacterium bovistauri]MCA5005490.1 hypothetical protein [Sphingobacterium bovistauri]
MYIFNLFAKHLLASVFVLLISLQSGAATRPFYSSPDSIHIEFEKLKMRYRTSFEKLKVQDEPDLGMLGIGADLFLLKSLPQFYISLNSYSAVQGIRPGLITFGTGFGWHQQIGKSPLSIDAGLYLGGGGGGGAPDGGGLITRGHIQMHYNINAMSIFGGYSRLDFPTGELGGHQYQFGISFSSPFYRSIKPKSIRITPSTKDSVQNTRQFRVTVGGQNYLHLNDNPTLSNNSPIKKTGEITLIGVGLDQFFTKNWYATLKLHGAVSGGIDGYMSYLVGLGYEDKLFKSSTTWDAQIVAGPSGGGDVATGGGSIVQANIGLRKNLGNSINAKLALGHTWSPDGDFSGTFLELGVSKAFQFLIPKKTQRLYSLSNNDYQRHIFDITLLNRVYFSTDRLDKNGYPYDEAFNLLGFKFSKRIRNGLEAIGATFWAYQGSYGAYAEGLLGVGYNKQLINEDWTVKAHLLFGAAGGGGINLGSGLVYQYQLGLERSLGGNWGIQSGIGQMRGLQGNFKPIALDFGITYKLEKTEKL